MSTRRRARQAGFGSLVVVVISMLIAYVLITLYLRTFTPTGPKGGPAGTLEAVKKQAQSFEAQQRRHFEELQREVSP